MSERQNLSNPVLKWVIGFGVNYGNATALRFKRLKIYYDFQIFTAGGREKGEEELQRES